LQKSGPIAVLKAADRIVQGHDLYRNRGVGGFADFPEKRLRQPTSAQQAVSSPSFVTKFMSLPPLDRKLANPRERAVILMLRKGRRERVSQQDGRFAILGRRFSRYRSEHSRENGPAQRS
jgi:hypothetical protein